LPTSLTIDMKQVSVPELNARLSEFEEGDEISIDGCSGQDFLLNGNQSAAKFSLRGDVGDFSFLAFGQGDATLFGNTGNFLAHSIQSGMITIKGNLSDAGAALGTAGLLSIHGNAGHRLGLALQGAEIVVRGNVGDLTAVAMRSGTIIIGGNAGKEFGKGVHGGTIYIRGEVESVSPEVEEVRLREPDKLKIGLLLLKAGIKSAGRDFRVFRSAN